MSSLLDALSKNHSAGPKQGESLSNILGSDFGKRVETMRDSVVNNYLRFKTDLNKSIAQIAENENLNDDQIHRIIEEVNNQVYLIKYKEMRNSPDREVQFDIASLPKIKEFIRNGEAHKPSDVNALHSEKESGTLCGSFEKKASFENMEGGDSLNFLNYCSYDVGSLNSEIPFDIKNDLVRKVTDKLACLENERDCLVEKIASDYYTIAEALIKYDRANIDVNETYSVLCREASLRGSEQNYIRDAITQKVAQMKEYRLIENDYELNLEFVDLEKTANEFSLGQYSLLKKADETQSNQNVPVVAVDNKTIRSVNDLINIADDISANKQKLETNKQEIKHINSVISKPNKEGGVSCE